MLLDLVLRQSIAARFSRKQHAGPTIAELDQIWQQNLVLGRNMAATFGPPGPNSAAIFILGPNMAAIFGPRDKIWMGPFLP